MVQFGQIGSGNPEVQRPNEPFNPLILNIIDKLKDAGSQLSRKNTRSPAASIYSDASIKKYGHISGINHRNIPINDNNHRQSSNSNHKQLADEDQDSNDEQETIVHLELPAIADKVSQPANNRNQQPDRSEVISDLSRQEQPVPPFIDSQETTEDDSDEFDEGSGDYYPESDEEIDNEPSEPCDDCNDCEDCQSPSAPPPLNTDTEYEGGTDINIVEGNRDELPPQSIDPNMENTDDTISPMNPPIRYQEIPDGNKIVGSSAGSAHCPASFATVLIYSLISTITICSSLLSSSNWQRRTLVFA